MHQLDTPIIGKSYVVLLLNVSWKNRKARFASRTVTWKDGTKLRFSGDLYLRGAKHAHSGDPAFEGAFEQARTLAAQQGTKVVVLLFPTKEEVYLPLLNQPVPRPAAPFAAELARRGIDYLDLTGTFTARARAGGSLYFELDRIPTSRATPSPPARRQYATACRGNAASPFLRVKRSSCAAATISPLRSRQAALS